MDGARIERYYAETARNGTGYVNLRIYKHRRLAHPRYVVCLGASPGKWPLRGSGQTPPYFVQNIHIEVYGFDLPRVEGPLL